MGAPDFPRRPLAYKFLYRALVCLNAYKCAEFQLPGSIGFWDKEDVPKFNVGATSPPAIHRTLKLCVLKVLGKVKQRAKFQHRISMHYAAMRMCIFHRLSIICAQKWVFWGFWGWRCDFLHLLYHRSGHIILLWGWRRISPSSHISVHLIESAQFLDFFLLTLLAIIVFSSCIYCIRPIQCQLSLH